MHSHTNVSIGWLSSSTSAPIIPCNVQAESFARARACEWTCRMVRGGREKEHASRSSMVCRSNMRKSNAVPVWRMSQTYSDYLATMLLLGDAGRFHFQTCVE